MQCPVCGSKEIIRKGKRELKYNDTVRFIDNNSNPLLDIGKNSVESKQAFRVSLETGEPFACDSSRKGYMYFDTSANSFRGCNGSEWRVLG